MSEITTETFGEVRSPEIHPEISRAENGGKFLEKWGQRWGEKWETENILNLDEKDYPVFSLAKNKARFLRMISWYKSKQEWLEVAPLSGVNKLFKQQTKELEGIRSSKLDYEMELEMDTLTPSQKSYRRDELKMCEVHERMAVSLIARMQAKIKSGRR